jgi:hypothetical protein
MINETTPDPDGYAVTARILNVSSPHGQWKCAAWDCPFCGAHFQFHGAGPDEFMLAAACAVIDQLLSGGQIRDTCECGARQRVTRELVTPASELLGG